MENDKHISLEEAMDAFMDGMRQAAEMPGEALAGFAFAMSCVSSGDDRDVAFAQGVLALLAKRLISAQN